MVTIFIVATALVFILLERIAVIQFRAAKLFRKYFFTDLFYLLTGFIAGSSLALTYIISCSNLWKTLLGLSDLSFTPLPGWLLVIIALVAIDAGNYSAHYLLHRFDLLWQLHKIHHSSLMLDWLATFRSHLLEQIIRRLLAPLLLILLGLPIKTVAIAGGIFSAWAIFNHSNINLNLRFLELIFITPRLHRIHHQCRTSQKNLGTVLTFWDRLRGSFSQQEVENNYMLGNGETDYPQGWLRQFIEPFRAAIRKHS